MNSTSPSTCVPPDSLVIPSLYLSHANGNPLFFWRLLTIPHPVLAQLWLIFQRFHNLRRPISAVSPSKHQVFYYIGTNGPPCHSRPRPLALEEIEFVEFEYVMQRGIIRRWEENARAQSSSPSTPTGGWRPCGDFRPLNAITVPERYSLLNIQKCVSFTYGRIVF